MSTIRREKNPALISLQDFNKQREPYLRNPFESVPNGIECPDCNTELFDNLKLGVCASLPPRVQVVCKHCNYVGYRNL